VNGSQPIEPGDGKKRRQPCGAASLEFLAGAADAPRPAVASFLTATPLPPFLDPPFLEPALPFLPAVVVAPRLPVALAAFAAAARLLCPAD
jgi:hypothetical protein